MTDDDTDAPDDGRDDVFVRLRTAAASVADRATTVRIDRDAVDRLASTLVPDDPPLLPEEVPGGDDEAMAAEVVAWNAVNFGSGWFPELRKRPGLSGARSLAESLADHVAAAGPPTADWLARGRRGDVRGGVRPAAPRAGRRPARAVRPTAWRDLGTLLADRFDGSSAELVRSAGGSAAALVDVLGAMPLAHDVATYGDGASAVEVPFYKRAQITVSHLARAFEGRGLGRFDDADRLTAFADNLVPHVLRMAGVLVYDAGLAARIDGGRPAAARQPRGGRDPCLRPARRRAAGRGAPG